MSELKSKMCHTRIELSILHPPPGVTSKIGELPVPCTRMTDVIRVAFLIIKDFSRDRDQQDSRLIEQYSFPKNLFAVYTVSHVPYLDSLSEAARLIHRESESQSKPNELYVCESHQLH